MLTEWNTNRENISDSPFQSGEGLVPKFQSRDRPGNIQTRSAQQFEDTHLNKCDERWNQSLDKGQDSEELGFNSACDRCSWSVFSSDETWPGLILGNAALRPAWRREFQNIGTGSKERNNWVEGLGDLQLSYRKEDDRT